MSLRIPIMLGMTKGSFPSDLLEIAGIIQAELIAGNLWRIVVGESSYCARLVRENFVAEGIKDPFSLWMIIQNHSADYRPGAKMLRFLKRAAEGPDNDSIIVGVWSAKELSEIEVVGGEEVKSVFDLAGTGTPSVPWVMMGESPEEVFKLDYRPDASEVSDDVELTPAKFAEMKIALDDTEKVIG